MPGQCARVIIVLQRACPLILSYFIQTLQQIINLAMLGHQRHLPTETLAAMIAGAGLGNTTQNLVAFSVMQGMNNAIDSFVS